jgi:hypothetical protein
MWSATTCHCQKQTKWTEDWTRHIYTFGGLCDFRTTCLGQCPGKKLFYVAVQGFVLDSDGLICDAGVVGWSLLKLHNCRHCRADAVSSKSIWATCSLSWRNVPLSWIGIAGEWLHLSGSFSLHSRLSAADPAIVLIQKERDGCRSRQVSSVGRA